MIRRGLPVALVLLVLAAVSWFLFLRPQTDNGNHNSVNLPIRNFALNLDPKSMAETESRKVASLLYSGLVAVDQSGQVEPRIAQSWKQGDSNTITFMLRRGLVFTNGKPITAAAVVASLCASMQPDHVQSATLKGIVHETAANKSVACTGLSTPAEYTVVIKVSEPVEWVMDALSGPGGWIVDAEVDAAQYGVRPGSGPYTVDTIKADSKIVLRARSGGSPIVPKLETVTFVYAPDDALAAQYFNSGRLDLLEVSSPTMAAALLGAGQVPVRQNTAVMAYPTDAVRVLVVNRHRLAQQGNSDLMIEQAKTRISAAIPRSAISENSRGLALPLYTGFPPAAEMVTSAPVFAGNPASSLLAMTILTENDAYSDLMGAMIAKRGDGIVLGYRAVDKGLLINSLLKGEFDLALIRVEATWQSPRFWAAFFTPGDPYVAFGQPLEAFNSFNFAVPDAVTRAGGVIDRDGNWIGVVRETGILVQSQRLQGIRITPTGQISLEGIGLSH